MAQRQPAPFLLNNQTLPVGAHEGLREQLVHSGSEDNGGTGPGEPCRKYIDGTKIESVANKYTFVWKKATLTNKAKLEEKIKSVLKQIDEGIAQDNAPSKEEGTMTDAIDSEHLQQLIDKVNEENSRLAQGSKEDKEKARQRQKAVNKLQKH